MGCRGTFRLCGRAPCVVFSLPLPVPRVLLTRPGRSHPVSQMHSFRLPPVTLSALMLGIVALAVAAMAVASRGTAAQTLWTLPGNVVIDPPAAGEFLSGWSATGDMTLIVFAFGRARWRLDVRAAAPTMGGAGKPVQDVYWRTDASSAWIPLTTDYVEIASGRGVTFVSLQFRSRLDWTEDQPGSYTAPLQFAFR